MGMEAVTDRPVLTVRDLRRITVPMVEEALGEERDQWAYRCHEVSLAAVRSGLFGPSRVARGFTPGLTSQHSWIVLGDDCYDPQAIIVDLTLWSYVPGAPTIYISRAHHRPHQPHGSGSWLDAPPPTSHGGEPLSLDAGSALSVEAEDFLHLLGPLDIRGWMGVAAMPVGGWPAAEIIEAMYATPALRALVPIDRVGMLTRINPNGLYLPDAQEAST